MTLSTSARPRTASSFTMRPSARNRTRSAIAAARGVVGDHDHRLAVARRPTRRSSSRISAAVCESRLPVGSSANSDRRAADQGAGDRDALLLAAGELGRAVAAAVARGRSDPAARRATSRPASAPAIGSGRTTFSSAVSVGTRLKDWKTKPMWSRRSRVSPASLTCVISMPAIARVPASACRGPRGCA